jgi:hypothetical protein
MGVAASLSVTLAEHEDGCVIMSWAYSSQVLGIDDCQKLMRREPFSMALTRLANWMETVEDGPTSGPVLYEALQLPFEDRTSPDV